MPLGIEESRGALVAEAVRIVRASSLPNGTNALFANGEGDWDEVMGVKGLTSSRSVLASGLRRS